MNEHRLFAVGEACAPIPEVRSRIDAFVESRVDLVELPFELGSRGSSALGGVAEMKAL